MPVITRVYDDHDAALTAKEMVDVLDLPKVKVSILGVPRPPEDGAGADAANLAIPDDAAHGGVVVAVRCPDRDIDAVEAALDQYSTPAPTVRNVVPGISGDQTAQSLVRPVAKMILSGRS